MWLQKESQGSSGAVCAKPSHRGSRTELLQHSVMKNVAKNKHQAIIGMTSAEAAHLGLLAWWALSIHSSPGSRGYREEGSELGRFFPCFIRNVRKCVGFNNMKCLVIVCLQSISEYTYPQDTKNGVGGLFCSTSSGKEQQMSSRPCFCPYVTQE